MDKHYDIAVTGVWFGANYGSLLNGYAIYRILKSMGLSVLMIHKPNAASDDWEIVNPHCSRFIKEFYSPDEISELLPYERLHELNDYCDMFLVGSDQIWHYNLISGFNFTFMLNFVDDSKKKISFGTSFGHRQDFTPAEMRAKVKNFLQRFHAVSVREPSGVDICRDIYGVKADVTIEPVFCLTIEEYQDIAMHSEMNETEPYIVTYILDPTPEIIQAIEFYNRITGMKVINILDGNPFHYQESKKIFNLPNTLEEPGAEDLIKLFINASFVITDSFHGTCFSLIFNKPFLSVANLKRGAVRFQDLLGKFNLEGRLVTDKKQIPLDAKFLEQVDFEKVNEIIAAERKRAISWLKNVVDTPVEKIPSIRLAQNVVSTLLNPKLCTGCSACICICPHDALLLKPDDMGYYRPDIDYGKCTNCGLCTNICPAIKLPENTNSYKPSLFEFIAADEKILWGSSSGGAFPLLAREAFRRGGVVSGAAWRSDFSVGHIIIDNENDLHKLQKSKYLQSYLGDTFRKIKEKLESNIFLLFSGCPCQVAGLKSYLGKEYKNLVTIDLLCGNAPSAMFFKKYLDEDFPVDLEKYEFRHKVLGWNADCITISANDIVRRGGKQDNYQRVYHNHTMCPWHCENCKYQAVPRFGDLTLGDFWGLHTKDSSVDVSRGVSAVLCNNEKGREFFDSILDSEILVKKEVPFQWLGGNGYAIGGSHNYASPKRDIFYRAIKTMPFSKAVDYALKPNHGIYSEPGLLSYQARAVHFSFDPTIWEEHYINGITVLTTKPVRPKTGKYATMPLTKPLKKGWAYTLKARMKIKSDADVLNFHIKDSGSNLFQVIHSHKISRQDGSAWVQISRDFVPDSDIYDEFMFGAAQVCGEGRCLMIDSIHISLSEDK